MKNARETAGKIFLALSFASAAAVAERAIDPLDRHGLDYRVAGPDHSSEVFYVSVDSVGPKGDEGDDRVGDALLVIAGVALMGGVVLRLGLNDQPYKKAVTESMNPAPPLN